VVAIGYAYGRWKKPDMAFANQLNMDIFVPALVFAALASKSFDIAQNLPLLLGATAVVLGTGCWPGPWRACWVWRPTPSCRR
jgi:predicted permease